VSAGEKVLSRDFIHPPEILSQEVSRSETPPDPPASDEGEPRKGKKRRPASSGGEVNWSLGAWMPKEDVERAFGVQLPAPTMIAPNQPFPHKAVYKAWVALIAATALFCCCFTFRAERRKVYEKEVSLGPLSSGSAGTRVAFSDPFQLKSFESVRVVVDPQGASGFYANGELVTAAAGRVVRRFGIPQSWSSRDYSSGALLAAVPAGEYSLKLETAWEDRAKPCVARLRVEQDDPDPMCGCCAMVVLSIVPLLVGLYHLSFEHRRWQQSFFGN
jgi:hypothetical protein